MAIAVELIKNNETKSVKYISYFYHAAGTNTEFGEIKIDIETGDVFLEILAEGDESEALAKRASWSLLKCFKKGDFPDKLWWQS